MGVDKYLYSVLTPTVLQLQVLVIACKQANLGKNCKNGWEW